MIMKWVVIIVGLGLMASQQASAKDVTGSSDYPGIKRYEGSSIVQYKTVAYDSYAVGLGSPNPLDKMQTIEGKITRIFYEIPSKHTALEIFRNYESELTGDGFTTLDDITPDKYAGGYQHPYQFIVQHWPSDPDPFQGIQAPGNAIGYYVGKMGKSSGDVYAAVLIAQAGDLVKVCLDIIETTTFEKKMVVVKAADMADALAAKGFVDLYGIYFDVDKADVKPESSATLDEVSTLMKIDRSLKLEISGHTDNTGQKLHNLTLSKGRADAVVQVLVKKYGIDPHRLVAKGYGDTKPVAPNTTDDGRAKNRRVELRKI
jgi:OOP family OmpA-OmpF porin